MIESLLSLSLRLSSIDRFTMEKLFSRESVLEHIGMISIISLALAIEVNARIDDDDKKLRVADVLSRAICHDVDEVITGDVARPTKYATSSSKKMFNDLSSVAIGKIYSEMYSAGLEKFASEMERAFRCAKFNSPEGDIVALADILAVVAKVRDEVLIRHNHGMVRQGHTAGRQLSEFLGKRLYRNFSGSAADFLNNVIDEAIKMIEDVRAIHSPYPVEDY